MSASGVSGVEVVSGKLVSVLTSRLGVSRLEDAASVRLEVSREDEALAAAS